jgi:hypothetical protein
MSAETPENKGEDEKMATTKHDPMLREHERSYQGFVKLLSYSAVVTVVVLILMALFLL